VVLFALYADEFREAVEIEIHSKLVVRCPHTEAIADREIPLDVDDLAAYLHLWLRDACAPRALEDLISAQTRLLHGLVGVWDAEPDACRFRDETGVGTGEHMRRK